MLNAGYDVPNTGRCFTFVLISCPYSWGFFIHYPSLANHFSSQITYLYGWGHETVAVLLTWFCYQLIAKPGDKTAAVSWPDPYTYTGISTDIVSTLSPNPPSIYISELGEFFCTMWLAASLPVQHQSVFLTHWGRDKMATISQTTFSSAFSWMKIYEFW